MHCYLFQFQFLIKTRESPSAAPLHEQFWQRVMQHPSALGAAVETLQACGLHLGREFQDMDLPVIGSAFEALVSFWPRGRSDQGWLDLLDSDSLQQYAMDATAPAPHLSHSTPQQQAVGASLQESEHFLWGLALAARGGKISDARLSTLLTHEGILAPLRAAPKGSVGASMVHACAIILEKGWHPASTQPRNLGSSPEAHGAAHSAMAVALRHSIVLLQLRAVAPARQQRAVKRAQKEGILQVKSLNSSDPHTLALQMLP